MVNTLRVGDLKKLYKNINLDEKLDLDLIKNRDEFSNIVEKIINKGANYVIRGMPINNHIKDILIDVKDSFKTKDFKEMVKTAVNSSIREGLEILSVPKNVLNDISRIKDIAVNGGLREGLCAGIDIISKKYIGKDVYNEYIKYFFESVKGFVKSNEFLNKISNGINNSIGKIENFKDICKKWYSAYDKFDIDEINNIANNLDKKKKSISFNKDCLEQNNVIQNMTELINNKRDKLSELQMQICKNL